ncbi:hypothetical protein [Pectobacterium parmentieri]|uniref:Uncharacterized protein n=1 Tax=Pectobacterium parmentieri TaxID=1905730 RepID=A0A8B3FNL3_PECPM|nr:hypothetical protein [Pectobacterium parmentieri]ACX86902.1 hypothetical protein Pecwa_1088 [Pectobacterium parmentieri WPP163]AOR59900.1 hypothetical protein A8F97_13500 [Pectobacterium parmentieri]AYH09112.1 hypothetical protein C5E24_05020 [Pectobacterium parmentieri]AYH20122.1 hypothetical protein C5E22_17485 [Pectobacterium parmentieri]AYH35482.1 hypothetical protein C5E17_05185 [Pectobacterium parmentieri]
MMNVDSFISVGDGFVSVSEFKGKIKCSGYIDGAMSLTINYVEIINISMWDYIDQLWIYILNALFDLANGHDVEFYFPDQPIKVTMTNVKDNVFLKVDDSGVMVDKYEFMIFMANSCLNFLRDMMSINGTPDYGSEIKLSLMLIEKLNSKWKWED